MAAEPRTPASDPAPAGRAVVGRSGSLVDENLEFMARLSLIEQALPLLRLDAPTEIAEALLAQLIGESGASAGVIWVRAEAGTPLERAALQGSVERAEPPIWPGEPESFDEALHAGRTVIEPTGSDAPLHIFVPCCAAGRLVAIAKLCGSESEPLAASSLHALQKLAEIGALALGHAVDRATLLRGSLRDPACDLPTRAYLDEVTKTEIQKARRFGRRLCLLCLDIQGLVPDRHGATVTDLVASVRGSVRTTDVIAVESLGRYWLLLTDSDPLGGTVLKRRILGRVQEILAQSAPELRAALGLASFPLDGETLRALCGRALSRAATARTSIAWELGIEPDTPLALIGERVRDRAVAMPGEVVSEAADLLIGELTCRPRDRGLLFFAPGEESAAFLHPLTALGDAEVATDVFVASEDDTIPIGSVVSALALPPRVSSDTSWIVRFGEAPPYALVAWPREADGARPVFHSSDPLLVEHMTFRLRSEVGFGVRS